MAITLQIFQLLTSLCLGGEEKDLPFNKALAFELQSRLQENIVFCAKEKSWPQFFVTTSSTAIFLSWQEETNSSFIHQERIPRQNKKEDDLRRTALVLEGWIRQYKISKESRTQTALDEHFQQTKSSTTAHTPSFAQKRGFQFGFTANTIFRNQRPNFIFDLGAEIQWPIFAQTLRSNSWFPQSLFKLSLSGLADFFRNNDLNLFEGALTPMFGVPIGSSHFEIWLGPELRVVHASFGFSDSKTHIRPGGALEVRYLFDFPNPHVRIGMRTYSSILSERIRYQFQGKDIGAREIFFIGVGALFLFE